MTLVIEFFSFSDGKFKFDKVAANQEFRGDDRESLCFTFAYKSGDFSFFQKEFPRSGRIVIRKFSGKWIGSDMSIGEI